MGVDAANAAISPMLPVLLVAATLTAQWIARVGPNTERLKEHELALATRGENGNEFKTKQQLRFVLVSIFPYRRQAQQFEKRALNCNESGEHLWTLS